MSMLVRPEPSSSTLPSRGRISRALAAHAGTRTSRGLVGAGARGFWEGRAEAPVPDHHAELGLFHCRPSIKARSPGGAAGAPTVPPTDFIFLNVPARANGCVPRPPPEDFPHWARSNYDASMQAAQFPPAPRGGYYERIYSVLIAGALPKKAATAFTEVQEMKLDRCSAARANSAVQTARDRCEQTLRGGSGNR